MQQEYTPINVESLLNFQLPQKIHSIPYQFEWTPCDFISKEFTKLNSSHKYRIQYLGPRYMDSLAMHKKLSFSHKNPIMKNPKGQHIQKYSLLSLKIIQSLVMIETIKKSNFLRNNLYYRAFQGMNPTLTLDKQYIFDSVFQSGNLDCAIKVKANQFDLFLRIDSNTKGHMSWFYFSVSNGSKKGQIILNICNLRKANNLYAQGMNPYIFSRKKYQTQKIGWHQGCKNAFFAKKNIRFKFVQEKVFIPKLYTLIIQYEFQYENDEVFFCYCPPYTYSQLCKFIDILPSKIVQTHTLCLSASGVKVPLLHITNHQQNKSKKKNILITGRVHPGQSNSSHILTGFIQFLCSSDPTAIKLRQNANFMIVPMLNPDGVILGNSRTSSTGKDLNRQYVRPHYQLFPQIAAIKRFARTLHYRHQILCYFDFHGHSSKKNTFFYGPPYLLSQPQYYKARILPRIIQKIANSFRYYSCSFSLSENKKRTGRAVMKQQIRIPYTYTVQSSIGFYYDSQKMKTFEFNQQSWQKMGASICQGIGKFLEIYNEYQQFLHVKKLQRLLKKKGAENISIIQKKNKCKFDQEQSLIKQEEKQDVNDNCKGQIEFLEMIKEVKELAEKEKEMTQQSLSSDDHDQAQDLQPIKFQSLNRMLQAQESQKQSSFIMQKQFSKISEAQSTTEVSNIDQLLIFKKIIQPRPQQKIVRISPPRKLSQTSQTMPQVKLTKNYLQISYDSNNDFKNIPYFHMQQKVIRNLKLERQANQIKYRDYKGTIGFQTDSKCFKPRNFRTLDHNKKNRKIVQKDNVKMLPDEKNQTFTEGFRKKRQENKRQQTPDIQIQIFSRPITKMMGQFQNTCRSTKQSFSMKNNKNTEAFPSSFYGIKQNHKAKLRQTHLSERLSQQKYQSFYQRMNLQSRSPFYQ